MTLPIVLTTQIPKALKVGIKRPTPAKHDTPHRTANAKAAAHRTKENGNG
jgi:hypothetical protein